MKYKKNVWVLCYWSPNGDESELVVEGVTASEEKAMKHQKLMGCVCEGPYEVEFEN